MNMVKPLIVGNWKMHGAKMQVDALLKDIIKGYSLLEKKENMDVAVCPPYVYLQTANEMLKNSNIMLGAQNACFAQEGAYTGEISPSMLIDLNCQLVILGHSERRQIFRETDEMIARKCKAAYDIGLTPILCLGESGEERKAEKTFEVLSKQLAPILQVIPRAIPSEKAQTLILAYEPIWAIGTGLVATANQVEEAHAYLRKMVNSYDTKLGSNLKILYGGSLKPDNAANLLAQPNVDGGLIGGASLVAQDFLNICQQAISVKV